ncbi:aromatic acid exporter family protein [Romboutsia sp. 1001216sp1]|uniref:FUSC family protein n=1 Tax=Romboutsia TaxID=1501226 RepID=UPI000B8165C4|nr:MULTISPECIES: aromatic acid exporter family protein [Romboutsia]MDB8793243.1 aromatic acid exporter family protein [Romboutsia sp. 1001216sp1]MDB8796035.1 aromatic acid exporter family protein [Romboutsia sp. 1001216sp1]MDB8799531.1 aromatic acid exporter family protein [Romboutsia sp. 1001216sp1]
MKLEKVGMRTFKTGLSVAVCVVLGSMIVQNPFYSTIACVVSVQDTVKGSLKAGFNRVKGTILGGIIGFLIVLIKPGDALLCGLGVIITIYLCNMFKLNKAVVVACVTFLSIHLGVINSSPAEYSFFRVLDTSIGVVVGVFINYILARPDYLDTTKNDFQSIEKLTKEFLELKILKKGSFNIKELEKEIKKVEGSYSKLIDELDYSRDNIDIEKIEETIIICREIYFHVQSIELLDKKLYLSKENYAILREIYEIEEIEWDLDESKSPVFNYHLRKIIEEAEILHTINSNNQYKLY